MALNCNTRTAHGLSLHIFPQCPAALITTRQRNVADLNLEAYITKDCLGAQEQCLQENTTGTISSTESGDRMNNKDMTES